MKLIRIYSKELFKKPLHLKKKSEYAGKPQSYHRQKNHNF